MIAKFSLIGPLIDFDTKELEKAMSETWRMSTPKEKSDIQEANKEGDDATDQRDILSAVHELLEHLAQQSGRMEERFQSLSDRMGHMNSRVSFMKKGNTRVQTPNRNAY